jgi:hypothetical protein
VKGLPQLRFALVWLACSALMLRALVPVGWMTTAAAGSSRATLMPCPMMDGMRGMPMPPQPPAKHQLPASHEGSICPFAAQPAPLRAQAPHRIEIAPAHFAFFQTAMPSLAADWDHAPRAPPLTA